MQKLDELILQLSNLKGIGKKNATRIAFDLLTKDKVEIKNLITAIEDGYNNIKPCSICSNLTDMNICDICSNENRDNKIICVVEDSKDVVALKNSSYNGLFHVLGGKIDPLNGMDIDSLNIEQLLSRLNNGVVEEIIIALNPDLTGQTTTLYLKEILSVYNVKVSKLASGLPVGGNIEYADKETLIQSIEGRILIK